jgi:hypothetical protein
MISRSFAVSVLFSVLSGCGGDEPSRSSGSKGESDAGATDARVEGSDAATSGERDAAADGGDRFQDAASGKPDDCTNVELTYSSFATPFFSSHCNRCHGAGDAVPKSMRPPPDVTFKSEADLVRLRDRIRKASVEFRRMPPGEPLSDCVAEQLSKYLDTLPGAKPVEPKPQPPMSCAPKCDGAQCGADGCGGTCGQCDANQVCTADKRCACAPKCEGKQCGDDGCGGSCGTCTPGQTCNASGTCNCVPNCQGKQCGSDGCGGTCGACTGSMVCDTNAGMCQATCTPNCAGKSCGDDGCGGSCGSCGAGLACNPSGQCACVPNCTGRQCGDNGCGGSCGNCASGQTCSTSGTCATAALDFAADVYPIFAAAGCGNSNCHGGSDPAQGMNLSSASNALTALVNTPANQCDNRLRVAPGAPDNSYLINKLTGQDLCAGERMPRGGAALPQGQIDTIRAWISGL